MILAPKDLVRDVSALSVRRAARRFAWDYGRESDELVFWFSPDSPNQFDEDMSEVTDVRLRVSGDDLTLSILIEMDPWDEDAHTRLAAVLRPLASRLKVELLAIRADELWTPEATIIEIRPRVYRKSVGQLFDVADQFSALAEAFHGRGLDPERTADLLRGRCPDALLGQPESEWVDAKRAPPQLVTDSQKFEFAKDIAAFANSPHGGLIVFGLGTGRTSSGDVITRLSLFPAHLMQAMSLRAIVRGRVYPVPTGLKVETVDQGNGFALGFALIPPQAEERRPFVVRGSIVNGKIKSHFVGIPTRVGDETLWDDLAGIHSLLVAGRAALRA